MTARSLMVVGTSSHVGKSLVVTALCRILQCAHQRVTPFKSQNMSLNAYVTDQGHEIAYAQAVQAWAARTPPHVDMNPILLKPQGSMRSQVILKGEVFGVYQAQDYYNKVFIPGWQAVTQSLQRLQQQFDWIVCEGAGSPAEVNLRSRDLVNMRVAMHLQAPTWLVADIDRGGALAHVVGTLQLLTPEERILVQGIVINKFRGIRDLLQPGLDWLAEYTGVPIVGVLPWVDLALPAEDSLTLLEQRGTSRSKHELDIAVIQLPRISNFTDFDPLRAEPTVNLRYVRLQDPLGQPDAVILPGTKATLADLVALHQSGLAAQLQRYQGSLVGICGGLQILGDSIADPSGLEGVVGEMAGLGRLPSVTRLDGSAQKVTQWRTTAARWPDSAPIQGYEIHQGQTVFSSGVVPLLEDPALGAAVRDGSVWGCYLHGLFDNHRFRRLWLNQVRAQKGLDPLPLTDGHYAEDRDQLFDELVERWHPHLDISRLGLER